LIHTHPDIGLVLRGAASRDRVVEYLDAFIAALERADIDRAIPIEILTGLKQLAARLEEILGERREALEKARKEILQVFRDIHKLLQHRKD